MPSSVSPWLAIAALAAAAGIARAEGPTGRVTGTVTVNRPAGVEPGPVVVYVVGFTEPPPGELITVLQKGKHFLPALVAITAGQSVSFPNGDPFLHNVFSPTPARRFDLGSYRPGKTRVRPFPRPGVVDVFCNIHPEMSATILVLPNRRFALADAGGRFAIEGVPVGRWTIFAYSRSSTRPVGAELTVTVGQSNQVELVLEEEKKVFAHRNKFGETYREPTRYR